MTAQTWTYTERIGGKRHLDGLIDEFREGAEIAFADGGCFHGPKACVACVIGTAAEVLRELIDAERV